jgi:pyruvate,water dikinase
MPNQNIVWFEKISKKDIALVGGKGANLGEMFSKFPIPNGFCVTVHAFEQFIDENNIHQKIHDLLAKTDVNDSAALDAASAQIERWILESRMPKSVSNEILVDYKKLGSDFVAVRSSATAEDLPDASFAGQQATYLNVKGGQAVVEAVKKCWASLYSPRAIFYRESKGFKHELVLISVVIQQMVDSKKKRNDMACPA